jgi:hypothetical protein
MSDAYAIPAHLPARLTISFWFWGYFLGAGEGDVFHDLEARFVELKERGFNTVRIDAGGGLCHTADGRPRGPIALREPFTGHSHRIRQMNFKGGRCDVLKRLVELFELAKRYDVQVILSSWFYLHTFWIVDDAIKAELFAVPPEARLRYFAEALDRLLVLLKDQGVHTQIAFVEILNEADGLPFMTEAIKAGGPDDVLARTHAFRTRHEEALAFLRARHPDILMALDTYTADTNLELIPRNMQVWNHHVYYLWSVYFKTLDVGMFDDHAPFPSPQQAEILRPFLCGPPISLDAVKASRNHDPDVLENWYRRIWLYRNLEPAALPALERWLGETMDADVEDHRRQAETAIAKAVAIRDAHFPGLPLVMGEAASYCGGAILRWEERSDTYWALIAHAVGLMKQHGYWGCMPRTNSGPEDPAWTEFPDRLRTINRLFLAP